MVVSLHPVDSFRAAKGSRDSRDVEHGVGVCWRARRALDRAHPRFPDHLRTEVRGDEIGLKIFLPGTVFRKSGKEEVKDGTQEKEREKKREEEEKKMRGNAQTL
jgi:hypothetical protein